MVYFFKNNKNKFLLLNYAIIIKLKINNKVRNKKKLLIYSSAVESQSKRKILKNFLLF